MPLRENTAKQQQRITSDGISQTPQTPPPGKCGEKFLPPVELEDSQPIINQDAPTSAIPEPAAVERNPLASAPVSFKFCFREPTEQIWQQVLAHLSRSRRKALLRQMGHLIEFDGTVARIGIKSQAWCNQAKITCQHQSSFSGSFQCECR